MTALTPMLSTSLAVQTAPAQLRAWTVGQLLDAIVIGRQPGNSMTLEIAGQRLQASGDAGAAPGARLRLEVLRLTPLPELRVLPPPVTGGELRLAHLRQALPRAEPLPVLVQALRGIAQAHAPVSGPAPAAAMPAQALPAGIAGAARQLLAALPAREDFADPAALQRAVRASGAFSEARLARALQDPRAPLPADDLKLNLLRLLRVVHGGGQAVRPGVPAPVAHDPAAAAPAPPAAPPPAAPRIAAHAAPQAPAQPGPAPPAAATAPDARAAAEAARAAPAPAGTAPIAAEQALLERIEAGLARLQVQQLQALAPDGEPGNALWLDLPARDAQSGEGIRLCIEPAPRRGGPIEDELRVTVMVPLADDAQLTAQLSLRGEDLSVLLHACPPVWHARVAAQAPQLASALAGTGLNPVLVACSTEPPATAPVLERTGMLDVNV